MDKLAIALNILKKNHYKLTKQRQEILTYLYNHEDYYLSLTQLDKHLRQHFPKMSHDTIYRNVKEMQEIGILETKMFASGLRVKFQCDFISANHSHFICEECGRTIELPLPDFTKAQMQLTGFKINDYQVEVHGICNQCQLDSKKVE
ncbi:Fur family transcriptional regulator [Lactobacillus sp. ESL0684]|uniref:Fur family transcriptional regulator n=1 Tax=unclassified Lactobacillus TaxID=2620435 RepID=UPI0023F90B94|nr:MULTISPECIES: Fur family transcriptional regulator [unclassified Lactobacillus]WEV39524.1 Fur family transcriptional regulator [Lactobacillus sp. ESL0681]WEV43961.1 Fur family transcriptional regulator [Lactobacillus sp. ESL0684]